jgi:hypothetical protein
MKGGGKRKGSAWERKLCQQLSLWVTHGEKKDAFWRSAMSGGRATRARGAVRQAGDITAVAPEGHSLTDRFYIEGKFYADLALARFFLEGTGILAKFWSTTCREAKRYGRAPMLIAKQNQYPALVLMEPPALEVLGALTVPIVLVRSTILMCLLDDLLAVRYARTMGRVRIDRMSEKSDGRDTP